jgi:lipooligosaccharide transport system ATP-binding protein
MTSNQVVIEARDLVKTYDGRNVVDQINLQVREGECFGLLGPNGAGKTSTMRMMYCSSPVTAGELFVTGLNVKTHQRNIKSRIGVVPQEDGLDPDFTVYDNLYLFASYHNLDQALAKEKISQLLHFMRLEDYIDYEVEKLSGGLKRRLAIARSLLNDPLVMFLDEPTTGLDPQARFWIWEALTQMKKEGKSLVLSTHYMEEAEEICDRIAIMHEGRILMEGTPQELIHSTVGKDVVEFAIPQPDVQYFTRRFKDEYGYQVLNNRIRLFIREGQDPRKAMELVDSQNIVIRKATLGDVFLKTAGIELKE